MAAGKHGGFRDNEFRDRESLIDASSRRVFNGGRKEYDRARNGNLDLGRGRSQDERGRVNTGLKDDRKREGVNRGYRSSLNRHYPGSGGVSNHCPRRGGFSFRTVEREPGELSNVKWSNDRVESGLQIKGNEMSNRMEEGIQPPVERKRKFSPIVCDIDDKEVSISSNCEGDGISMTQPLQPSLAQVYLHSSKAAPHGGISASFSSKSNDDCLSSLVIAKSPTSSGSNGTTNYNALVDWPSGSPNQQSQSFTEVEHGGKEEYCTRRILSSRWVTGPGSNSPDDEGEILDDEAMLKIQKNVSLFESVETRWHRISSSPDAQCNSHEVADVPRQKSCVSVQSSIADDYHSDDLGNDDDDIIEMDLENERRNTSVSWSGSNSEEESDFIMLPEPMTSPQRSIDMLQHCRSLDEYEKLNKINEGTYGVVYRARDKKTGEIVALKKVKMEKEREGFPLTSLREINILLSFHHPSIVDVKEVVMGNDLDSIFMVMEYMEHDLKGLMETMKQPFSQSEVKCLMLQLLEGVKYLHDNWVLHRDLKTSNLLLNNQGELKICDFGLARQYGSPLKTYTHLVVTLWYRAPELLLGSKKYSTAIDMWSLGCIMAELLSKEPLFNGKTEIDQLDKIFKSLGTPNETIWPGFSELPGVRVNFVKHRHNLLRQRFPVRSFIGSPVLSESGFDLLNKLLTYDPEKRITVDTALNHEWFCEVPLPKSREFMPTFPSQNTQNRCMRRILKSPDPLEEQRKKEMQQVELGTLGLFGQER